MAERGQDEKCSGKMDRLGSPAPNHHPTGDRLWAPVPFVLAP